MPRCFENGNGDLRVCAKFDQFLPVRSHFDTKRPVNFFHIATFPSPTFGPLSAFHCPFFFYEKQSFRMPRCFENGNGDLRVCAKFDQFTRTLSFRHQTSRKFFSHSNFPIPYLWTAFCVPLSFVFYEKQ